MPFFQIKFKVGRKNKKNKSALTSIVLTSTFSVLIRIKRESSAQWQSF